MSIRTNMASCFVDWSGTGCDDARPESEKAALKSPDREGSMPKKHPQQPKTTPVAALAGYQSSTVTNFAQAKSP